MKLPDRVYDILKWVACIAIPALNTFLAVILPAVGTADSTTRTVTIIIGATGTFIGALIGVSCYNYNKEQGLNK